ncbi:hypothetical protein [Rhizobium freirei]|uniref:hypothetical protein n=1 Tax=Rhizobium freirei TaxID=1353277 RepID=UPI0012FAD01B
MNIALGLIVNRVQDSGPLLPSALLGCRILPLPHDASQSANCQEFAKQLKNAASPSRQDRADCIRAANSANSIWNAKFKTDRKGHNPTRRRQVADMKRRLSWLRAASLTALGLLGTSVCVRAGSEHAWLEDPASHCRFVAPASLTAGPTFWIGDCPDDKASGTGMLRRRDGDRVGAAFFGKMKNGIPDIGVVDLGDGYRAGSFDRGDIGAQAESDPQVRIDAFRVAVKAARLVSLKYKAEHKDTSAQFYETLARTFEAQLE